MLRRFASRAVPVAVAAGAGTLTFASANEALWFKREAKPTPLSTSSWKPFTLVNVEKVNHDTSIFSFALNSPEESLNMPVASCISVSVPPEEGAKRLGRPYTPVSPPGQKGTFELMIKKYATGNVSEQIHGLQVGDAVEAMGPWEKIPIIPNMKRKIGMIAGGTGITPMLQVLESILSNTDDHTSVTLLFANKTPSDVLLKERLDRLATTHDNFTVVYTVDRAPILQPWDQLLGHVTKEMVEHSMPAPAEDALVLVCGPDPMLQHVCGKKGPKSTQGPVEGLLAQSGYTKDMVYKF